MKLLFSFLMVTLMTFSASAQKTFKKVPASEMNQTPTQLPTQRTFFDKTLDRFEPLEFSEWQQSSVQLGSPMKVIGFSPKGSPTWVKGSLTLDKRSVNIENQAFLYLEALKGQMSIKNPTAEFKIVRNSVDDLGLTHIRMNQQYKGIPVFLGEVILHAKDGVINRFNGTYFPTPEVNIQPSFAQANALETVKADLSEKVKIIPFDHTGIMAQVVPAHQETASLVIYYSEEHANAQLAWLIKIHPNITEQWQYLVDAHSGAILEKHINSCKFAHSEAIQLAIAKAGKIEAKTKTAVQPIFNIKNTKQQYDPLDGSLDASGLDLNGFLRNFKTYHVNSGNNNFLIDVTRDMFNAGGSNLPDEPAGGILTINGNNGNPQGNSFQMSHLTNSNASWSDAKAVSAHYNAGLAYDYYKNTFGRNSINGSGGTIYSIINVADENGQSMDNAFWNGTAMFYGNGDQAFKPLAGALDVAGHEISHGVISNTANLEYQGESGALNESFADIFGAMIDRDDWKMGEDVVTNVFPSGALRDLQNPHNGGNSLGDNGYQPAHVNEQYTGSQDNGGVHINSGITNKAYYLFATAIGKDKAEQVYYRALTKYLTKHSQFKDLRIAVLTAAEDLHGAGSNEVTQAGSALDQVGITGPSTGGGGGGNPGSNYQTDLAQNPGEDYIVYIDKATNKLNLVNGNGLKVNGFESSKPTINQPSVTDDGSAIYYVADDNVIHKIAFNWAAMSFSDSELAVSDNSNNANVAVSPDGKRIAAVELKDNVIYVYNFAGGGWKGFKLKNPTNSSGISTDNVLNADVLYFDYSGEYIMYDAKSSIKNNQGGEVTFWDIGFVHVWQNGAWGDGSIEKLFSGLPENTSVGNPTFAKNSPYIIAFDYQDGDGKHTLVGSNIETGASATIATNDTWSRPSFAPNDQFLLADTKDQSGTGTDIVKVPLAASKYEYGVGDVTSLVSSAGWGAWFANGTRSLILANEEVLNDGKISIAPNPFQASVDIRGVEGLKIHQVDVFDLQGRLIRSIQLNAPQVSVDLSNEAQGLYLVKVMDEHGALRVIKAIKQ